MDKSLVGMTKKKKRKIINIKSGRKDVTKNHTDIKITISINNVCP